MINEKMEIFRDNQLAVSVQHSINVNQFITVPHLHYHYEIYYNINGGKSFLIENEFYECGPRDLFVIPKTHIHKVVAEKNMPYERCVIHIDDEIISSVNSMPQMNSCLSWLDEVGTKYPRKVRLSQSRHEKFMMHIREYDRLDEVGNELMLYSKLLEILAFARAEFGSSPCDDKSAVPESWSDKALGYIEKNFRKISVLGIATSLYVNEDYLNKVFKAETGITLNNYIILRKIAEAKKLLYLGHSVKETCVLSGFNDYANFIRTFKRIEGCSPGSFEIRKATSEVFNSKK
ncbi:MAG: helix-turn-helix domain-containing protein [Ruminococcaceae bacterium]|nr:helix-turn-helix domain-containing protein [Oscillospiraceae bacterium]